MSMHEDSKSLRVHCHADINRELDRLYSNAQINRLTLVEHENLYRDSQAGEWELINQQITKNGKPLNDSGSLSFLVRCWEIVPTLLRTIYKLEKIIIDLIAKRLSATAAEKRAVDALEKHRAEIAKGQTTGPEHEFALLVKCAKLGCCPDLANLFRRWCQGHSIWAEIAFDYNDAVRREDELLGKLDGAPEKIKEYFRAYCRNQGDKP